MVVKMCRRALGGGWLAVGVESVASSSLAVAVGDGSSVGGSECLVVEVGECS